MTNFAFMRAMHKLVLIIGVFYFSMTDVYAQCAMCKATAEIQAEDDGSSINTGIIYIMVIPYLILLFAFRKKIGHLFRELKKIN
jgi:hypothetical protein